MDNNKIDIKYFVLLFVVLILVFSWCLYVKDIKEEKHYNDYQLEIQSLQDSFNNSQKVIDSLNIVANTKEVTIINNTYIYEQQNKKIGSASRTVTDSLFKANLQSDYKKYGHLITN
jgi:hypothetical protein